MTGKGVRWGRDRLGRSAPAFLSANTFALPPPTCTARQEAGRRRLRPLCLLQDRPTAGCLFLEACAGRRIRWLCPPAVPVQQAVCLSTLCLPCPLPFTSVLAPVHFALLPLFLPCAPGSSQVKATCLQAARLSRWQLQHGPAVAARAPVPFVTFTFFLQSP